MNPSYTYSLSLRVFLDNRSECYRNIITINELPQGPLRKLVKRVQNPMVSPFEMNSQCCPNNKCIFALLTNCNEYMMEQDIPNLISFLHNNGYSIDTKITKLLKDYHVPNEQLLFYIQYTK